MASHETGIADSPPDDDNPNNRAASFQDSEESSQQKSGKRRRDSDSLKRQPVPWDLKLNITVTEASQEGRLIELRVAYLKTLSEEGGYDKYPFGNPAKRIHGLYIKHNGHRSANVFCPYHSRLKCPFRVKIRLDDRQLLIWTAHEHDHDPANDTSKHIKVETAKKVKQVIAEAPIGDVFLDLIC